MDFDSQQVWELHSNRLTVLVAKPGMIYKGSRFDHTGHIVDIVLDGTHHFGTKETNGPLTSNEGIGFCCEFGIDGPLGYSENQNTGAYLKIGVGIIHLPSGQPYDFNRKYETIPYTCEVSCSPSSIRFETNPMRCGEYSARLSREISVDGLTVVLRTILENTGDRAIETSEYCHNFIHLGKPISSENYTLTYRQNGPVLDEPTSEALFSPSLDIPSPGPLYHAIQADESLHSASWILLNRNDHLALSEELLGNPSRMAVWGLSHVVSPEIYTPIRLQPGEKMAWSRKWQAYMLAPSNKESSL